MPMVWIELTEDVIGTDGVWRVGERRAVGLRTAADWIEKGWALPSVQAGRKQRTEAPERGVMMHYFTPEGETR